MTRFIDTDAADAFIATASDRETSVEIMEAIAFFARDAEEAVYIWEEGGSESLIRGIWENATGNGHLDDNDLYWGGQTLSHIMNQDM